MQQVDIFAEQREQRRQSYLEAIAKTKTNRITFCADTECKAEILELLKDIKHKIINIDGWFLTIEI